LLRQRGLIIADSAEPKSIDELRSYGLVVLPSTKGPGSVLQGIQYMQAQRVSVTKRSTNLIKEYRNHMWQTDKEGKIINEPEPGNDHALDGARYKIASMKPKDGLYAKQTQFASSNAYRRSSPKASSAGAMGGTSMDMLH
jgi:phage terminase large subunit